MTKLRILSAAAAAAAALLLAATALPAAAHGPGPGFGPGFAPRPLTVPSGTARRPRVTTAGTAATGPGSWDRLPPGLSFTEPLPHCVTILP